MYKLTDGNSVIRLADGACIPMAKGNRDFCIYEEWLAEGNIPQPAHTDEELQAKLIADFTNLVQNYLDTKVKERNYDNILSLCTYATSTNPAFAKEGQAGVVWRDSVWAKCYAILAEVKAGTRATPTEEELLAELPLFTWGD